MNCEELRVKLYKTIEDARRYSGNAFSNSIDEIQKSIDEIKRDYTVIELRDYIMNLGTSRVVPSHHHEIPGRTEIEVEEINLQIDRHKETRYEAASEYKFCFLEAFTKDESIETDPTLMGFYQDSVPKMLEILKEIRQVEENNPEILPKIDQIAECLRKGAYWEAIGIADKIYQHYKIPESDLREPIRYRFPTEAYETYAVHKAHLKIVTKILDSASFLEKIISELKQVHYKFKRPWDYYLPRIITGFRHFDIKAFDHFDLCIVGAFTLQDEIHSLDQEQLKDDWHEVVDLMGSVPDSFTQRNYPYPLFKSTTGQSSKDPFYRGDRRDCWYINRK